MNERCYQLATFNCKGVKRALDSVRELCQKCVLVSLQETWLLPEDIPFLSTIDSNFGYAGTSAVDTSAGILRGRPHGGVALLWNTSVFKNVTVLPCNNERICAVEIITSERPIIVISVYMPTNCVDHLPQFTDCLSTVSALIDEYGIDSVFILGDFNAHPCELFFEELKSFCSEQLWTCIDVEMLGIDSGEFTYISDAHGSCSWLDHCVVTQAAKRSVVNASVMYDVMWSDHFPLIIECNLNLLTPIVPQKMNLQSSVLWGVRTKEQIDLFRSECNKRIKLIDFPIECVDCADHYCNNQVHKFALDRLYSDIVSALSEAARVGCRGINKRRGGPRIAGWNNHVRDAHGVARIKFLEWVQCGRPKTGCMYEDMINSRRIFKSRLKSCQNRQDQIKMDTLATLHSKGDFRSFWKSTNKCNVRPGLPMSVAGVHDSEGIANTFREQYAVQGPLHKTTEEPDVLQLQSMVGIRYSAKQVASIIKGMTKGKSPGHDGLSIEHLHHAGPHVNRVLAMLYSLCVSHSYLPGDFMKTVVVPVAKNKSGDLSDINNYRPISLATIIAKVFDGLLNSHLNSIVPIHDNQFGFRPKLSTESAILGLKHTVRYYTDRKTPVYACFLDMSKAFDTVSYDLLWNKLKSVNVPSEVINIFKYWYSHQVNYVRWAGAMSESYLLECGVRQGGLTSPTLFNLYIDALIVELSELRVGCHIDGVSVNNLSYADDMVLLSASMCGLRKLVRVCEEYAMGHGLRYNVRKSQYMVFESDGKNVTDVPTLCLNGVPLERVDKFKYLGHWVASDLRDHVDMERERRALSRRANMLSRRFARCAVDVKVTLFRAYCTSLYTCSLWVNYTKSAYSALRVQYNNAFRAVLGLPRHCSASGMFATARTSCFNTSMRLRAASLVRRVRDSSNSVLAMIAARFDCPYIKHCSDRHLGTAIYRF